MNVFDFFRDRWRSDAVQLTLESIGAAQISGPTEPPVALRAGERYFRITLAEMTHQIELVARLVLEHAAG